MELCAVIAAAGLSSRMGADTIKPLLPLRGSTMIGETVRTLKAAGVTEIIVVTGRCAESVKSHLKDGVVYVHNLDYAVTDMFHSAKLGLGAAGTRSNYIYFLPADTPLFTVETLYALHEAARDTGADAVIPAYGGRRGHPVILRSSCIARLLAYEGDGGLRAALSALCEVREVAVSDGGVLLDADYRADYDKILLLAENESGNGEETKRQ